MTSMMDQLRTLFSSSKTDNYLNSLDAGKAADIDELNQEGADIFLSLLSENMEFDGDEVKLEQISTQIELDADLNDSDLFIDGELNHELMSKLIEDPDLSTQQLAENIKSILNQASEVENPELEKLVLTHIKAKVDPSKLNESELDIESLILKDTKTNNSSKLIQLNEENQHNQKEAQDLLSQLNDANKILKSLAQKRPDDVNVQKKQNELITSEFQDVQPEEIALLDEIASRQNLTQEFDIKEQNSSIELELEDIVNEEKINQYLNQLTPENANEKKEVIDIASHLFAEKKQDNINLSSLEDLEEGILLFEKNKLNSEVLSKEMIKEMDSSDKNIKNKINLEQNLITQTMLAENVEKNTVDEKKINSVISMNQLSADLKLESNAENKLVQAMTKELNPNIGMLSSLNLSNQKHNASTNFTKPSADELVNMLESNGLQTNESKANEFVNQLTQSLNTQGLTNQNKMDIASVNSPITITAEQQEMASEELSERINMMLSKNLKQVDIRLDPPELGRLQIKLAVNQDSASVQFTVSNQSAREMVENTMPRLREMLQQQGIALSQSSVQQESSNNQSFAGGQTSQQDPKQGQSTSSASNSTWQDLEVDDIAINTQLNLSQKSDGIDFYA